MVDLYDKVKLTKLEINPAASEIKQLLNNYARVCNDLNKEIVILKGAGDKKEIINNLKNLRKKVDKKIIDLSKNAALWTKTAGPKSYLKGQDLADIFIKKQSRIVKKDKSVITIYDLKPRDKVFIKNILDKITDDLLREVNMINSSWKKRLDNIIRKGIRDTRSINLIKRPGIKGVVTTVEEIGTKIFKALSDEGLKLIDRSGRYWEPERYVRMYSRTRTRELQTQGIENRMGNYGLDLVKISEHLDVDGQDICNDYEGNIYSLSGDHPRYPLLTVRTPFHPNCCHVETPWVEKYHKILKEMKRSG